MAKPSRGPPSPSSGSGSDSSSRSRSRSRSNSRSRSGSASRFRSLSSSSPSLKARNGSRSPRTRAIPSTKGPVDGTERATSPPIAKKSSPAVMNSSPSSESLVLQIDSLSRNVNEAHLEEIFSNFGEVALAELAIDRMVNLPKGYGYVEFRTQADAEKALLYMDGAQIDGNVVRARFTLPPRQKASSPKTALPKRNDAEADAARPDSDKDGQKRNNEPSPPRRDGSPRQNADSSPRRRIDSPARFRVD